MFPNTFALGYDSIEEFLSDVQRYGNESIDFDHDNARMLLVGAVVVSEIRAAVYNETGNFVNLSFLLSSQNNYLHF